MKEKTERIKIFPKCSYCKQYLTDEDIDMGWHFGNRWFCGNACATAFSIEEIIKLKRLK